MTHLISRFHVAHRRLPNDWFVPIRLSSVFCFVVVHLLGLVVIVQLWFTVESISNIVLASSIWSEELFSRENLSTQKLGILVTLVLVASNGRCISRDLRRCLESRRTNRETPIHFPRWLQIDCVAVGGHANTQASLCRVSPSVRPCTAITLIFVHPYRVMNWATSQITYRRMCTYVHVCVCADRDGPKIIVISSTHTLERPASNCNDARYMCMKDNRVSVVTIIKFSLLATLD